MGQYVIRGGRPGFDRLQVLARSWAATTTRLLDVAGVTAGMDCLDLGCGAGDVTFALARRVAPGGRVRGLDMDEVKLGLARDAARAAGLTNVEFAAQDVYGWAEPGRYDVVYCRNLLQHLTRPVDVLRAMWDAVRPGGVVIVEDADFEGSFCDPPHEGFDFWVQAYMAVLRRHGGDPLSGRRLHRRFVEAGIPATQVSVVQRVDSTGEAKTMPLLTVQATADAIVAEQVATAAEVESALASLQQFADDPGYLCGSPRLFQAWARRDPA